jgi:hypothetical protein
MYKNSFCRECIKVILKRFFYYYLRLFICRDEWEWLHKNSVNNNEEPTIITTTENESDETGLSLFKTQFQDAAKDLCLMLSMLIPLIHNPYQLFI